MNRLLACFFTLWIAAVAQAQTDNEPTADKPTVDEMKSMFADAAAEFTAIDIETQEQFKFMSQSVLNWSNPERKTLAGGLFFWTSQSRPVVALCVYPDEDAYEFEFQSLTDRPLQLQRDNQTTWQPAEPGIVWKPLDTTKWAPHKSPLVRRRQMRQIANAFEAKLAPPGRTEKALRLQAAPLHRYLPESLPDDCLDGAVFCFVQGTDPEVLLMIEAIQDQSKVTSFRYALARTTMVPIQVHHNSNLVLELGWAVRGYRSPYTVIRQPK